MPATYDSLATVALVGNDTYTFSSISSAYTDLRLILNGVASFSNDYFAIRFNGDTTSSYSNIRMTGNGSTIQTTTSSGTFMYLGTAKGGELSNPLLAKVDIFSYAGSLRKTLLIEYANNIGAAGSSERSAGTWNITSAINSITIFSPAAKIFAAGSTATLYGIKAA